MPTCMRYYLIQIVIVRCNFMNFFSGKVEKIRNYVIAEENDRMDEEFLSELRSSGKFLVRSGGYGRWLVSKTPHTLFRGIRTAYPIFITKADGTCELDLIPTWMIKKCTEVMNVLSSSRVLLMINNNDK